MASEDFIQPSTETTGSMRPAVVRYGLIGGLAYIIVLLITQLTGLSEPGNTAGGVIGFLLNTAIMAGIAIYSIRQYRDEGLHGHIAFGKALQCAFLAILLAGVISSVFAFVYYSVIDTSYLTEQLEAAQRTLQDRNMSEEQIEAAMNIQRSVMTPGGILVIGVFFNALVGIIVSLIVAAVMKRPAPQ